MHTESDFSLRAFLSTLLLDAWHDATLALYANYRQRHVGSVVVLNQQPNADQHAEQTRYPTLSTRMKIAYKAIAVGCAIEASFASLFALGGFGPCGPNNPLGYIGLLAHFFPGMFVAAGIDEYVTLSGAVGAIVVILIQASFWSLISLWFLKARSKTETLE